MGPQPWGLRKLEIGGDGAAIGIASMGPQPWGLRKPAPSRLPTIRKMRFNGAAALGAAETALAFHLAEISGCTVCRESLFFGA
jgi:hypothetical protein